MSLLRVRQPDAEQYSLLNVKHAGIGGDSTLAGAARTPPVFVTDGTYQWPTLPSPSLDTVANTGAELTAALAAGSRRITIPAGFGTQTVNVAIGDDTEIIMSNSATIDGDLTWVGDRSRIIGGNHIGGVFEPNGGNDITVDGFNTLNDSGTGNNWGGGVGEHQRIAILNTIMGNTNATGDWVVFTSPTNVQSDWLFANVRMYGDSQMTRFQQVDNLIIVDSVLDPDGSSVSALRTHCEMNNVWVADTHITSGWLSDPRDGYNYGMDNATFERFQNYTSLRALCAEPEGGDIDQQNSVIRNSICNTSNAGDISGTPDIADFSDGGGNVHRVWDGVSYPDFSHIGVAA